MNNRRVGGKIKRLRKTPTTRRIAVAPRRVPKDPSCFQGGPKISKATLNKRQAPRLQRDKTKRLKPRRKFKIKRPTTIRAANLTAKDIKEAEAEFGKGGLNNCVITMKPTANLRENFLNRFDIIQLRQPNRQVLQAIWNHYDADRGGTLDPWEVNILAVECIERTLRMLKEQFQSENPNISRKRLQQLVDKEKLYYLPGENKHDAQTVKDMIALIAGHIDVNNDGEITRQKFFLQFGHLAGRLWIKRDFSASHCVIL